MKYANLHFHSTHSDGILTPKELAVLSKELGFGALALEPDGSRGDGSLTPYTDDVRTGITKEEFDALKKRIYG